MSLQGAGAQERTEQNTLHPLLASPTADTITEPEEGLVQVISTRLLLPGMGF